MAKSQPPSTKIFVLCENAILSNDKKWSIINIFDQLHSSNDLPFEFSFVLFINIELDEGEHIFKLYGNTPESKKTEKILETTINTSPTRHHQMNIKLSMQIAEYGIYKFIANLDEKDIGTAFMNVIKEPRPLDS